MPCSSQDETVQCSAVSSSRSILVIISLLIFTPILARSFPTIDEEPGVAIDPATIESISGAAIQLIEATTGSSREQLHVSSLPGTKESGALFEWNFLPGKRTGLRLDEMNYLQRIRAQQLVRSTLSETGFLKWNAIVALEIVLRDMSKMKNRNGKADPSRNAGQYTFCIVGDPAGSAPWGWRVEGHHISLRFLLQGNRLLSSTPAFLGAAPTVSPVGPNIGMEVLGPEETIAMELAMSLHGKQKQTALRSEGVPRDILHGPDRGVSVKPEGIRRDQLEPAQRELLDRLIDTHLGLMCSPMLKAERARIDLTDPDSIRFCWWGSIDKLQRHSYRIHGPTVLIELVRITGDPVPGNDQEINVSGHVHIVRRDPSRDLDVSPLREHLEKAHKE
ncbi:MAG TPA: DUF3500 domain-containing protein [Planctomycetes bacterium]|nr:DUF3500 domain-containing protein [Planctomycetota bacterium]